MVFFLLEIVYLINKLSIKVKPKTSRKFFFIFKESFYTLGIANLLAVPTLISEHVFNDWENLVCMEFSQTRIGIHFILNLVHLQQSYKFQSLT